jgi:hypothetical protein
MSPMIKFGLALLCDSLNKLAQGLAGALAFVLTCTFIAKNLGHSPPNTTLIPVIPYIALGLGTFGVLAGYLQEKLKPDDGIDRDVFY